MKALAEMTGAAGLTHPGQFLPHHLLVRDRVDRLPVGAESVLRWAATLGTTFSVSLLSELTSEPDTLIDALEALEELCAAEGILTALETSHAFAAARKWSQENPGKRVLIGNSGRGDKDMPTLTKYPPRIRKHASA